MLNVYRKRQGLTHAQLGEILGVSEAAVQRYCMPAGDAGHRRPNRHASEKLREWSEGEIHAGNYADPWIDTLTSSAPERPATLTPES